MSRRIRITAVRFILTLLSGLLLMLPSFADSVEHLSTGTDMRFLPYRLNGSNVNLDPEMRGGRRPRRVLTVGSPTVKSEFIAVGNPPASVIFPSHLSIHNFPVGRLIEETPLDLHITDAGVMRSGPKDTAVIWLSGYRKDSSWVLTYDRGCLQTASIFLVSGHDETGDGLWKGVTTEVGSSDYDYDGVIELFVYINAERDLNNRTLLCVDVLDGRVEWKILLASPVAPDRIIDCRDSLDPGVIIASYNVGQGARDSIFSDQFGYLTRLNVKGEVVWNRIVTSYPDGIVPASVPAESRMYLGHTLRFLDPGSVSDSITPEYLLSEFDADGHSLKTVALPEPIQWIWPADCDGDGSDDVYVQNTAGLVRVFTRELDLICVGDTLTFTYVSQFDNWPGQGRVFLMQGGNQTAVMSPQLKMLATLPLSSAYAEAARLDSNGDLETLLAGSSAAYGFFTIEQNDVFDHVVVFYHENQMWVLVVLFSLLTGLVITNLFRRRVSRQKARIEEAHGELKKLHQELEETHRALKQAQATIIAQEKYRQAKDIAGGFAHEIRNALFPADSSLTRLRTMSDRSHGDPAKIAAMHDMIRASVERALDITKQISGYTKLESAYSPEAVNLRAVVERVIQANQLRIDDLSVGVTVQGETEVAVTANFGQLFSVFNNLLLNALDSLTGRNTPVILISWLSARGEICIKFEDNGTGIPEKDMERIFDAFFSTKPNSGTGLGLSVAKRVVEMYGGSIKVSSCPGEGAAFEIRLMSATGG